MTLIRKEFFENVEDFRHLSENEQIPATWPGIYLIMIASKRLGTVYSGGLLVISPGSRTCVPGGFWFDACHRLQSKSRLHAK